MSEIPKDEDERCV